MNESEISSLGKNEKEMIDDKTNSQNEEKVINEKKDDEEKNNTFIALKNASGYIRREIGQRINLRYNPQIIFELDDSINYGMHIEELIQKVKDK